MHYQGSTVAPLIYGFGGHKSWGPVKLSRWCTGWLQGRKPDMPMVRVSIDGGLRFISIQDSAAARPRTPVLGRELLADEQDGGDGVQPRQLRQHRQEPRAAAARRHRGEHLRPT